MLYIPVWRDGVKIYTGDSHAVQGDGEVNLTAIETAMRDVRVQVILHEQPKPALEWPFAETPTHWIAIGTNRDLAEAFRIALRNANRLPIEQGRAEPTRRLRAGQLGAQLPRHAGCRYQPGCARHDSQEHLRPRVARLD